VEQAPDKNRSRDEKKPERLIAPEDAALLGAARLLVGLLLERLDPGLNHGVCCGYARGPDTSIGHAPV
jgi:hypothetical protein